VAADPSALRRAFVTAGRRTGCEKPSAVGNEVGRKLEMSREHKKYERLLERAKTLAPLTTAVAHPCDESSLAAAVDAARIGVLAPLLVGPGPARARQRDQRRGGGDQGHPLAGGWPRQRAHVPLARATFASRVQEAVVDGGRTLMVDSSGGQLVANVTNEPSRAGDDVLGASLPSSGDATPTSVNRRQHESRRCGVARRALDLQHARARDRCVAAAASSLQRTCSQ
jgi:phosphate acetyltransferase